MDTIKTPPSTQTRGVSRNLPGALPGDDCLQYKIPSECSPPAQYTPPELHLRIHELVFSYTNHNEQTGIAEHLEQELERVLGQEDIRRIGNATGQVVEHGVLLERTSDIATAIARQIEEFLK